MFAPWPPRMFLDSLFLFLVLTLLSMSGQANTGGYFWKFKIWETYTVSQTSLNSLVGTGDCSPKGSQTPLSVPFKPRSDSDFECHCPFFSQTKDYCKKGAPYTQEYGGCPS
jgi:hypothetical protein